MARVWTWVAGHHEVLVTVMTGCGLIIAAAGVVVAAIYARLTHGLALAARRQAELTEALFESGHRPWLYIAATHDRRSLVRENFPTDGEKEEIRHQDFVVAIENKGPVPAIVTGWRVVVQRDPDEPRVVTSEPTAETAVYPNETERLAKIDIEDRWQRVKRMEAVGDAVVYEGGEDQRALANVPVWLKARVAYRGVTGKAYVTEAVYNVGADTDYVLVCKEMRLR